jgi:hypothetical protein
MKYIVITTITLITGFYIKSNFFTKIETPNSPRTFDLTQEQINELQEILDRGETLDQDTKDKLDPDFSLMLGEEDSNELMKETLELRDELNNKVEDLLNEELQNELNTEVEELANEQFQCDLNTEVEESLSNLG